MCWGLPVPLASAQELPLLGIMGNELSSQLTGQLALGVCCEPTDTARHGFC